MFPVAGELQVAVLIRSALFAAESSTHLPFPYASLRGCLFFSHLRQCEGSRELIWLECVPARLVATQILFMGVG